jgi:carboxyl-terminal processing protease
MSKLKTNSRIFLAGLFLLLASTFIWPHGEFEPVSTATREGRLAVFDDAWTTVDQRYYDPRFHGVDWSAQRLTFREVAGQATSDQQLYAVLRQMLGRLNDPHTRVFSPEEKFDWWRPRFLTIGLSIKEVDGLATVVKVERNSATDRAGIRAGDVIESVDNQTALTVITQRLGNSAATDATRRRAFATLFDGPAGTAVDLVWKNSHDERKHARFERYWRQRDFDVTAERLSGDYLAIELDAFTVPLATTFLRNLKDKISSSRGIILDLRNNGGGDAQAMAEIASLFLGAGVDLGEFTDRSGGGFNILTSLRSAIADSRKIKVPLVLLTSERTSSAAEIFVSALKQAKAATVIGTQTCGCVLAIRNRHELPDGGVLDVSEMDYQTPTGEHLEGTGISPDQLVMVHRSDLYAKRDPAIIRALAYLKTAK